MNPEYIMEIFHKTAFSTNRPLNLEVNSIPNQIKKETDYTKFREFNKIGLA